MQIQILTKIKTKINYSVSVEYYGLMDLNKEGLVYVTNIHAGRDFLPARGAFVQALYEEFKKYNVSPSFEDERKIKEMNY